MGDGGEVTGRIRIGTASWTDKSLIDSGLYYPRASRSAEQRLRFYAAEFPMVEVDSSYYALPTEQTAGLWARRTPTDFLFNVKAFRLFTTHGTRLAVLPPEVRADIPAELKAKGNLYYRDLPKEITEALWGFFERALLPLDSAGKLGVVVFQFPPWFMPNRDSHRHIEECRKRLPQYNLAVEFRNQYWLSEDSRGRTFDFLRDNHLSFIAVDEPQGFTSSVPPIAEVTGPYAIARFHGRNRETWEAKGLATSAERFDYYYSEAELQEWVPKVRAMAEQAREVHVVMNTNRADQGIANAHLIGRLLGTRLREDGEQERMV